jgi:hypothetical protein
LKRDDGHEVTPGARAHAKYFWRRFVAVNGADLIDEIQSLMKGFGDEFTVNFV